MNSTSNASDPKNPGEQATVNFFSRCLATGLFSGYSPIVPGTAGSLVGLAFYLIPGMENPITLFVATIIGFFAGGIVSGQMERRFGEDPHVVVIDEIVGMWISLLLLPKTIWVVGAAFILFRMYDTIKPPPARRLEHVKQGWGVMLDDVAAAAYANVTVRILMVLFPGVLSAG